MRRNLDTDERTSQPPIEDYAIIGDCRTAALVSRAGSVDWYCLPRFDSPSVFGALLDGDRGGCFRISPIAGSPGSRRYLPGTNVLETTFESRDGVLRITDAMSVPADPPQGLFPDHEILRKVECLGGEVEVEVICDPRFDYGRRVPVGERLGSLGIQFDGGRDAIVLHSDIPLEPRVGAPGWSGRETLRSGERRFLSLSSEHQAPPVHCPLGDHAEHRLTRTAEWWRGWLEDLSYEGAYEKAVRRSILTLKLLAYPPSGAIVAAATTSLPEQPGGSRNWDYRYCWLRDASMTLEVLLHLGFTLEGEAFMGWLLQATRVSSPRLGVLYDVHGRTHHPEATLDHLAGYRGSRPVRVGNRARGQFQLDTYGELIRAAWIFKELGGELDRAEARFLRGLGEVVCSRWREPDNGIWEIRGERRHYTYSKAMCWVALDRLLALHSGGHVPLSRSRREVEEERDAIRHAVETEGWNESRGSYVAWFGSEEVDSALLLLGIMGYDEPGSERIRATQDRIRRELGHGRLLYRYRYGDGLEGGEAAFGICSFWEVELLARQHRLEEAVDRFDRLLSLSNDVGLYSEEIRPRDGALLGNFPQAFTHIGLISAADAIARARGRGPELTADRPETTKAEGKGDRRKRKGR